MQAKELKSRVRASTSALSERIDALVADWLKPLLANIDRGCLPEFRPKQVNDPIWGTIELLPWEVALLDTNLLQRMRGVRQLGLAQLVFPSASYDRLEHIIGTVGAVEETLRALSRQIERWNRDTRDSPLPSVSDKDRYAIRLAALLHDIGHGPFSHAIEPVMQTDAALPSSESDSPAPDWRDELNTLQFLLKDLYQLNASPSVSEAIAVMMVLSPSLTKVLASDAIFTERGRPAEELQVIIVAAIIGAVDGPGASHLSALISSQIDADKLDYLARDAYHAGLEIGFDTSRLLARLELLAVRADNLDDGLVDLRKRASESPDGRFYQIGIAAAGFGSFEQMLIGRTFLYDRLYHHHKVRAAEATAQRLILVAQRDRKRRFELDEIFLGVADDTFLGCGAIFADSDAMWLAFRYDQAASTALQISGAVVPTALNLLSAN
ncbi:HD domain-containing protein [Methylocystis parvus]|uniref:HD domain-containing protein n=2 Tax=Methylocystis parvus TaxID=134 RepID=A0A6B8MDW6_9HYPH|nr:HD domain-containing protein [Methylocystis parvus]QGM99942.1 HD domain-containing protein [Methylocystis parvus]WBK02363.1 HD domain-containing protein [Methylocystis parvus OBBP]